MLINADFCVATDIGQSNQGLRAKQLGKVELFRKVQLLGRLRKSWKMEAKNQ